MASLSENPHANAVIRRAMITLGRDIIALGEEDQFEDILDNPDLVYGCPDWETGRLYVGPGRATWKPAALQELGITHIVNAAGIQCWKSLPYFKYFVLENLPDSWGAPIHTHFEECNQFIHEALKTGNVFVHCSAGVSRSPTLVMAYLIDHLAFTADEALKKMREVHPPTHPNPSFLTRLREFDQQLKSRIRFPDV